jgi:hypothetical protein
VVAGAGAGVGVVSAIAGVSAVTSVSITVPSEILSPSLTSSFSTTPECEQGMSIAALSDSMVTSEASLATLSPGLTRMSMTATSLKLPMSGTLISMLGFMISSQFWLPWQERIPSAWSSLPLRSPDAMQWHPGKYLPLSRIPHCCIQAASTIPDSSRKTAWLQDHAEVSANLMYSHIAESRLPPSHEIEDVRERRKSRR